VSTLALAPSRASRSAGGRPLAVGVACSAVFNGLVILALVAMTTAHRPQDEPPALMHFQQVPPPPPPPPPPPQAKAQPESQPDTVLPPLPQLDIPDAGSDSLELPAQVPDTSLSLPLGVPGFATKDTGTTGGASFEEAFDEPPTVTTPLDLEHFYPTQARLRGIQGESSISLRIDAGGQIASWAIVASTPPGIFEQALDRMVHSLRFSPAKRSGVPIPSTLHLRFKWTLNQ